LETSLNNVFVDPLLSTFSKYSCISGHDTYIYRPIITHSVQAEFQIKLDTLHFQNKNCCPLSCFVLWAPL